MGMLATRVLTGIQLDGDQVVAPGIDRMYAATRREMTEYHPWVMLPTHWMSRDGKADSEDRRKLAFEGFSGERSLRWGHAHPTWTYWCLPFLGDLLYEKWSS